MKKMLMVVSAMALSLMVGCASGNAGEDKVAKWQKDRTPVQVLKSQLEVKAVGAAVEALDVAPFAIYKGIADRVDNAAVMERYRRIYLGYVADVKALEEKGTAHAAACKEVLDAVKAQAGGAETIAKLKEYLAQTQKTNFDEIMAWIQKITEELQAASQKFAQESPNVLQQVTNLAQKEGGLDAVKILGQGKDDLAVISLQLKDAGVGLALYDSGPVSGRGLTVSYMEALRRQRDCGESACIRLQRNGIWISNRLESSNESESDSFLWYYWHGRFLLGMCFDS